MSAVQLTTPPEVAKRVLHRIETEPESHNQTQWVNWPGCWADIDDDGRWGVYGEDDWDLHVGAAALAVDATGGVRCGTTACIAGWAVLEALDQGAELDMAMSIREAAAGLLGLAGPDGAGAANLLFAGHAGRPFVTAALAGIAAGEPPAEAVARADQRTGTGAARRRPDHPGAPPRYAAPQIVNSRRPQ